MRLTHLAARGWRNLADIELEVPAAGVALLGANGQGKTNLLEAIAYPVLFRSFRGALDADAASRGGPGFRLAARLDGAAVSEVTCQWVRSGRRKRVTLDGVDESRLTAAVGRWLAVVFHPADVGLAGGPAEERRRFLDRMLSLADAGYLRALLRYRQALLGRNAALRQGRLEVARACVPVLAEAGARLVRDRLDWVRAWGDAFAAELAGLGEPGTAELRYRAREALADPAAWADALAEHEAIDRQRGMTMLGPHRDDLLLHVGGRLLRRDGSTGQVRSGAIALRLLELETLRAARAAAPALVLDDVFAELDAERQQRLAARLAGTEPPQVFVSAPRAEELPPTLPLPVWRVTAGEVRAA